MGQGSGAEWVRKSADSLPPHPVLRSRAAPGGATASDLPGLVRAGPGSSRDPDRGVEARFKRVGLPGRCAPSRWEAEPGAESAVRVPGVETLLSQLVFPPIVLQLEHWWVQEV